MKILLRALAAAVLAIVTFGDTTVAAGPPSGPGGICGGIAGFQCKRGLFCDMAPNGQCGAADQSGTCRRRPRACIKIFKPVCGCDGKTYSNDCVRRSAGVGKLKNGACN